MPLSPPLERTELHHRRLDFNGYVRSDGLFFEARNIAKAEAKRTDGLAFAGFVDRRLPKRENLRPSPVSSHTGPIGLRLVPPPRQTGFEPRQQFGHAEMVELVR